MKSRTVRWLLLDLFLLMLAAVLCFGRQTTPDKKRMIEIQNALLNHGYLNCKVTGKMDVCTRQELKDIAIINGWQRQRVPDARVLILLGLGNKYSDPVVTDEHSNHLDPHKEKE